MSRLYANVKSVGEVAAHFGVGEPGPLVYPQTTVEGEPGVVIFEREGERRARVMTWGFPRLARSGPDRIGLVADLTNPMWDSVVADPRYRCLIPITHFANPAGDEGAKTRTWFSVTEEPLFAWGGFCRNTPELGPVFAGMTMNANELVEPYNDRMPVLVRREEWRHWLSGPIKDIIYFQIREPLPAGLMTMEHTDDRWRSGKAPPMPAPQLSLI
ncbi:putative SOS response-associated peptidase YedK [Phenylobacterium haematophilum]|uniref:Putative SOS response-associated peptidase YedK n=1 Tax=Phenylobacterium haematophilum TaxID=98513 RepID=A0A839ZXW3_9CAUL|nr:SOS response-associated peptidase family protein [Phenylobacterium haematophilum]MBB3890569.1 putative SOS response-associated peptidase YedK [Phenylobacterium haematophilum]